MVKFSNIKNLKSKNLIRISNPLPKVNKKNKYFYISDGSFQFKNLGIKNKILSGISAQDFILEKKKDLIFQCQFMITMVKKNYILNT